MEQKFKENFINQEIGREHKQLVEKNINTYKDSTNYLNLNYHSMQNEKSETTPLIAPSTSSTNTISNHGCGQIFCVFCQDIFCCTVETKTKEFKKVRNQSNQGF